MTRGQNQKIKWAISRMQNVILWWRKLDSIDRMFLLRKFRDEHANEFYQVAREHGGQDER